MDGLNETWMKLEHLFTGAVEYFQTNPKAGYLFAIFLLLIWLIGLILDWKWTYARPGSWGGNFLLDLLGPTGFRFWMGVLIVVIISLFAHSFFNS